MVDTAVSQRPARVRPVLDRAVRSVEMRPAAPTAHPQPCPCRDIFSEEWWLDAVTLGRIERVDVAWDSVPVGTLYYHVVTSGFLRKAVLPPYTRVMTPYLVPPGERPWTKAANAVNILRDLYAKMPEMDTYHTVVRSDPDLIFGLQMNGFTLGYKVTFLSDASVDMDTVFLGMDQKYRNVIRQGNARFALERHADLDRFRRIRAGSRQADYNDYRALGSLLSALVSRGAGTFLTAVSDAGEDQATALVVWDRERLYYLAAARYDGTTASKAATWLFYEAIAFAKRLGLAFDADGYATVASAQSLQRWGLPVSLNANVSRSKLAYQLVKPIKDRLAPPPF